MSIAHTSSSETLTSHLAGTYDELVADVSACATLESLVCGKGMPKAPKPRARRRLATGRGAQTQAKGTPFDTFERVSTVVKACRAERKRARAGEVEADTSDEMLFKNTRFTDSMALATYAPFLHYVPRLVNIVRKHPVSHSHLLVYLLLLPHNTRPKHLVQHHGPNRDHAHKKVRQQVHPLHLAGDACRGCARAWLRAHVATRLVPHSGAMQRRLLCKQALRRRAGTQSPTMVLFISQAHTCVVFLLAARLHAPALPCTRIPYVPSL